MSEFEKNAAILELAAQRDMLLKALGRVLAENEINSDTADLVRTAIAKARGE
jgi:hypothetical protein